MLTVGEQLKNIIEVLNILESLRPHQDTQRIFYKAGQVVQITTVPLDSCFAAIMVQRDEWKVVCTDYGFWNNEETKDIIDAIHHQLKLNGVNVTLEYQYYTYLRTLIGAATLPYVWKRKKSHEITTVQVSSSGI